MIKCFPKSQTWTNRRYDEDCCKADNSVLHMQWLNPLFWSCYREVMKWSRLSPAAAFVINLVVYRRVLCVGWSGFFLSDHETDLVLIMVINHQDEVWRAVIVQQSGNYFTVSILHALCVSSYCIYWTPGVCVCVCMCSIYWVCTMLFDLLYAYYYFLCVYLQCITVCVCPVSLIEVFLLSDCHGFQMPDYQPLVLMSHQ